jgi:competence protein ComGC
VRRLWQQRKPEHAVGLLQVLLVLLLMTVLLVLLVLQLEVLPLECLNRGRMLWPT